MEISLCMIVKNEEETLGRCLDSVSGLMDEIIIVDTGSEDRTKEIAAKYTDKVFDFVWTDDFAAARNFSFSKATKDYCMWLDADDILKEENRDLFRQLKVNLDPDVDIVFMPYHYSFTEDGRLKMSLMRERIVKRSAGFVWEYPIHENLKVWGTAVKSGVTVTHSRKHGKGDRNFKILETVVKNGENNVKLTFYYGVELYDRDRIDESIAAINKFFEQGGAETPFLLEACILLHDCYFQKKRYDLALKTSQKYLEQCIGSPKFCWQLGRFYIEAVKNVNEAVYWYELALQCPAPDDSMIIEHEYYYYVPCLELGKAYCALEKYEEGFGCLYQALEYNANSLEVYAEIARVSSVLLEKGEDGLLRRLVRGT